MTSDTNRPSGLWFEEFEPGQTITHPIRRTITEFDNVSFTTMTMNPAAVHLDAAYAATTEFKEPLVNSMLTVALLVGLSVHNTTMGTTIANLGFETVNFPHPVFAGDTIRGETEIVEVRASKSRPAAGIVKMEHRAYNQSDELVCVAIRSALMHRKPD